MLVEKKDQNFQRPTVAVEWGDRYLKFSILSRRIPLTIDHFLIIPKYLLIRGTDRTDEKELSSQKTAQAAKIHKQHHKSLLIYVFILVEVFEWNSHTTRWISGRSGRWMVGRWENHRRFLRIWIRSYRNRHFCNFEGIEWIICGKIWVTLLVLKSMKGFQIKNNMFAWYSRKPQTSTCFLLICLPFSLKGGQLRIIKKRLFRRFSRKQHRNKIKSAIEKTKICIRLQFEFWKVSLLEL